MTTTVRRIGKVGPQQMKWVAWLLLAFTVSAFCALGLHASCLILECGPARDWAPLLTPFVTISVLIVGYAIWIDQTKLKRRFEVAEQVMLAFIAATDALWQARVDVVIDDFVADRPKAAHGENAQESRIKNRWYAAHKRLLAKSEVFDALGETELLCALYLGRDAKASVVELRKAINRVHASALMLMMTAGDVSTIDYLQPEQAKELRANVRKWERDCSRFLPDNPVNDSVAAALERLKAACSPYVMIAELDPL